MGRILRTRAAIALGAAAVLLTGCATDAPARTSTALHVVAALRVEVPSIAVASQDRLWVFGAYSGVLTEIDPTTNTVVRKVRPLHPPTAGIVVGGSLWVVSFAHDVVMELDADTGERIRTLDVRFREPVGIAFTAGDLWVVNHRDSTLMRIDPRSGSLTGTTSLPGSSAGAPLVAGGYLWIGLADNNAVVHVDPSTGEVVGEPLDLSPTGTCAGASAIGTDVWFTGARGVGFPCGDGARRVDAVAGSVGARVYGPGKHLHRFARLNGSVFASDRGHTVYRLDVGTGALQVALVLEPPDDDNNLLAAFGSLWVLRPNTGRVVRVDTA